MMHHLRRKGATGIIALLAATSALTAGASGLEIPPEVNVTFTAGEHGSGLLSFTDDLAASLRNGGLADYNREAIVLTAALLKELDGATESLIGYTKQIDGTFVELRQDEDGDYQATFTIGNLVSEHVIGAAELQHAGNWLDAEMKQAGEATQETWSFSSVMYSLLALTGLVRLWQLYREETDGRAMTTFRSARWAQAPETDRRVYRPSGLGELVRSRVESFLATLKSRGNFVLANGDRCKIGAA